MNFGNFNKIRKATLEDFEKIEGVGDVMAESIYNWLRDRNHQELLDKLLANICN